jgi:hypothetical protein
VVVVVAVLSKRLVTSLPNNNLPTGEVTDDVVPVVAVVAVVAVAKLEEEETGNGDVAVETGDVEVEVPEFVCGEVDADDDDKCNLDSRWCREGGPFVATDPIEEDDDEEEVVFRIATDEDDGIEG